MADRWRVLVTRDGDDYLAEVEGLESGAHTEARSLEELDRHVREVIVLGADLPGEAGLGSQIAWVYR